jgi:exodeoxyribonuclease VII large subunit
MRVYTVSEITREIKNLIENSFPPLWIEGEVTDLRPSPSEHLYFSLKDEYAILRCILFREDRALLSVSLRNGVKVRVYGELNIYEKGGRYNLIVRRVYPVGFGDLQLRFEELKRRLMEEGLFDEIHKKEVPEFPERIGVVTALKGAAIRDIINVLRRRMEGVEIIVRSTKVQGEGAGEEIANAIDEFNEYGKCDLLIVGRGGGSIQDLWAFNEEIVARAIYRSKLPIISAVGHEIDFTIADFVADKRAPTPSAAAELAVKDQKELIQRLETLSKRIKHLVKEKIEYSREKIEHIRRSYGITRPINLIYEKRQNIDDLRRRLSTSFIYPIEKEKTRLLSLNKTFNISATHFFNTTREKIENLNKQMNTTIVHIVDKNRERISAIGERMEDLSPGRTLKRGYSICFKLPEMRIITDSNELNLEDKVQLKFYKGKALSTIVKTMKDDK